MAAFYLSPISAILQYFTDVGIVLAGGKINTYLAGSSSPTATWTDITGNVPNSNPIILGSNGRLNNVQIWQQGGVSIKVVITDANNNQLGPTFDQVSGINDPAASLSTLANATSGQGADLVANAMRSYDIFSSLRAAVTPALAAGQTLIVDVEGASTVNDGFGGIFYWSASSAAADDGLNVIKPTAVSGNGRYLRQKQVVAGTFTGTLTGMGGATTGTFSYLVLAGFLAVLQGGLTGTSNSTAMTMTGLPANIIPATIASAIPCLLVDNGLQKGGWATVNTGGSITFGLGFDNNLTGFTAGGSKGTSSSGFMIVFPLR